MIKAIYRILMFLLLITIPASLFAGNIFNANPANYLTQFQQMQPGDTLLLQAGDYLNGLRINNKNGTPDKWFVIKAQTDYAAVLLGRDGSNTMDITNSSYVKVEGLKFDGKNIPDIDAIKAGGNATDYTHHIWIYNNIITGHGNNQQVCGISTKITSWDWVISHNRVLDAGTGIYLGNSDGSMPFIRGIIEFNLVLKPVGYCMQIKHQNNRPDLPGIPKENTTTIIRHNTFSKDDRLSPDGDRPNLLVGGQPLSGTGVDDRVEIYGNFLNYNPRENLFQGTGNISIHNNIFVNQKGGCVNVQSQNGRVPKEVFIYQNTFYSGGYGIRYDSAAGTNVTVSGNAVFATIKNSLSLTTNLVQPAASASNYLNTPSFNVDSMDFFPMSNFQSTSIDISPFAKDTGSMLDFNGSAQNGSFFGAYSGKGINPGWKLALDVKDLKQITTNKVWYVGPARNYKTPSAVMGLIADGDTILIDAGLYSGDVGIWTKSNLFIKCVGGFAHIDANGKNAGGKAIWVIQGNNTILENIEFSGCTLPVDKNGAGIRMEGTNLTIRHCFFHDNDDGILAGNNANSDILIEFSEFARNGFGDGYSHNLYINHVKSLTFRYNYSHHAKIGHNLKSRAYVNYILYNRIMDEDTGNSSYLINLPSRGLSYIFGNILMKGKNADNKVLIDYGSEDTLNPLKEMYVINNTLVNKRQTGTFVSIKGATGTYKLINNLFLGVGNVLTGTADTSNNLNYTNIATAGLIDEANYDYHLKTGSPAIDAGIDPGTANNYSLTPLFEYKNPVDTSVRKIYNKIDIGAYEFVPQQDVLEADNHSSGIEIYPNPVLDNVTLRIKLITGCPVNIKIYDLLGNEIKSISLGEFNEGEHLLNLKSEDLPSWPGLFLFKIVLQDEIIAKWILINR